MLYFFSTTFLLKIDSDQFLKVVTNQYSTALNFEIGA
jgi:hypothetical protein